MKASSARCIREEKRAQHSDCSDDRRHHNKDLHETLDGLCPLQRYYKVDGAINGLDL
jgi:hypothetical protein